MKNQFKKLLLKSILLLFFSFLTGNLHAQKGCPDWQWAISKTGLKFGNQTSLNDAVYSDVATDAAGNTYITGDFSDSISFGSIKLRSNKYKEIFVAKLDNKGIWQWAIKVDSLKHPWYKVASIASDISGNIYITGKNVSSFDEFFVARINSDGQFSWLAYATIKNPDHKQDVIQNITTDLLGNIYISGFNEAIVYFGSIKIARSPKLKPSYFSPFIAKLDSTGNWKWGINADGYYTNNKSITTDASGNIYYLNSEYDYPSQTTYGFVRKIDSNGQLEWRTDICSLKSNTKSNVFFTQNAISSDRAGNIYVTGSFVDTVNFNGKQLTTSNSNNPDLFVVGLDNTGKYKWVTKAGGNNSDSSQAIISGVSGEIYLAGNFSDSISFGHLKLKSSNAIGLFVAGIDSTGSWRWAEKLDGIGTLNNATINKITLDSLQNIFLYGNFNGSLKFGNKNLTSISGKTDLFFSKLKGKLKISTEQNLFINCGNNINLNAWGTGYNTIEWYPKTGLDNPNILTPIAAPLKTTIYTITAKNLCGDSVTSKVTVNIKSDINIKGDSTVCPTSVQYYKANTDTTINHTWNVSGGTILSGQGTDSVSVLWGAIGKGNVKLVNTSKYGCKDSISFSVKIDSTACDWVWPGDANHDKIANSQDILKIGLAYNETGSARNNASSFWKAQYADNWTNSFQSGVNYKHADCNGDGIIDSADINVISNNYGQTWKKRGESQAPAGPNDADLVLEFTNDSLKPGDTAVVNIKLGTTTKPATNVYGLAFSFSFNPDLIESNTMKLNLSNSWLAAGGKGLISLTKEFNANGYADIAISKTDKKHETGNGSIGTLSFVIKGQGINLKTLKTEIRDLLAITNNEDTIPLNTFGDSLIVYQKSSAIQEFAASKNINIYPNPSKGNFILDLKDLYAQKIQVINMLGQVIWNTNNVQGKTEIQLNEVIAGLYYINIQTLNGVITKPVIINK